MEARNSEAMRRGREYMLAKLANLPIPGTVEPKFIQSPSVPDLPNAENAINAFRKQFGDLYIGIDPAAWYGLILTFRLYWRWRRTGGGARAQRRPVSVSLKMGGVDQQQQQIEIDDVSAWSANILNRSALAIEVDFSSGRITVTPETLLDWLVLSLMECRRNLAICGCKECPTPYFVKTHPRAKYCSLQCSAVGRQCGQREWEKAKRKKT